VVHNSQDDMQCNWLINLLHDDVYISREGSYDDVYISHEGSYRFCMQF